MAKFVILFSVVVTLFWALIPQALFLVSWAVGRLFHYRLAWTPWLWASVGVVLLWWVLFAYGYFYGRFRKEIKEVVIEQPMLPSSFDGYRIVHISDLHLDGWKGYASELWRVVKQINDLKPDAICFTGDLVSMNSHELDSLAPILQNLEAKDGVFSVLGNHDYSPYVPNLTEEQREGLVDSLVVKERDDLGWHLLMNEHFILRRGADSIAILGVENQSCGVHSIIRRGDLPKAMAGTDGMYRILLSHDPSHWRAEVVGKTDIPMTLSGHTHAMQMRFFGWTPSRWAYPECDGQYNEGVQTLYVNIGLGGTLPMRIGATPEITLITLRKSL